MLETNWFTVGQGFSNWDPQIPKWSVDKVYGIRKGPMEILAQQFCRIF